MKTELNRRDFFKTGAGVAALGGISLTPAAAGTGVGLTDPREGLSPDRANLYVATTGDDRNPGTEGKPFATISRAKSAVRDLRKRTTEPIRVVVRGGTYYLPEPLTFGPEDSGTAKAPVTYAAYPGERVTLSGGRKLDCRWEPYRNGIVQCSLQEVKQGGLYFTQLFVNGKRQSRARYPNLDPQNPLVHGKGYINPAGAIGGEVPSFHPDPNEDMTFSGEAPRGIVFDPATFTNKRWARPEEAVIHIFQANYWGNLQWRLKEIDWAKHTIWFGKGAWQMGAKWYESPAIVDKRSRFYIENVFEELDAPGEWYLDPHQGILFYLPAEGVDLNESLVEAPVLKEAVRFAGTQDDPVHDITLEGFRIAHTSSTFLEEYDVPSLSDWAIHRGGSVFFEGARSCTIKACWFDAVGGNAVFMNNYNRANVVTGCKFTESGDSAICFVGALGTTNGTQRDFPFECQATNNLIHDCGVFGKQIAGVYISRAKRITVGHNLIYNLPRAGICIGDGTWGGHVIEHNYIHDTVLETGDHGPFNAWGRDKYWCLSQSHMPYTKHRSHDAGLVRIDAMESVIVRHNLFQEKSGWGLNLDDGASNYEIYNNLCVGVSMKLREGAYRTVYNNVWVNSAVSVAIHVGNEYNHDRYFNNITVMREGDIYGVIAPPAHGPWLEEVNKNCLYSGSGKFSASVTEVRGEEGWPPRNERKYTLDEWRELGFDKDSIFADPLFIDPKNNDYRVRPESPALKLGFRNFDMDTFGLTKDFQQHLRDEAM